VSTEFGEMLQLAPSDAAPEVRHESDVSFSAFVCSRIATLDYGPMFWPWQPG
jgi:hypothetical protein